MTHCPNTFRLLCIFAFHTHTWTLSHTLSFTPFFLQLNHTVQLKQVGPENHMAFHTEHADSPTAQGASLWCCVVWITSDMGEEGDRLLAAEQVGNAAVAGLERQWMGRRGEGGWGQSSAALLHPEGCSQKWQSDVIAIVTHKPDLFILSTSRMTRGGEREVMKTGKTKRGTLPRRHLSSSSSLMWLFGQS